MWNFRHKEKCHGSFERHKARLVGDDEGQHIVIDFGETFCLVGKLATIYIVLSIVLSKSWQIHQECLSTWRTQRNCIYVSTIRL